VLEGTTDRADAAVAGQLINTLIRCCGLELRVREVDELEARMVELEEIVDRQNKRGA